MGNRLAVGWLEANALETPHQFVDVAAPFVDVPRDDGEPIDRLPGNSAWSSNDVHRAHRGAPFRKTSAHVGIGWGYPFGPWSIGRVDLLAGQLRGV